MVGSHSRSALPRKLETTSPELPHQYSSIGRSALWDDKLMAHIQRIADEMGCTWWDIVIDCRDLFLEDRTTSGISTAESCTVVDMVRKHTSQPSLEVPKGSRRSRRIVAKALDSLAKGLIYAIPVIWAAGLSLLVYQGVSWLKHGTWKSITILDAFKEFLPGNLRIDQPTNWLGLWQVTMFILSSSAWWVLMLLSMLLAYPLLYLSIVISNASDKLSPPPPVKPSSLEEASGAELLRKVLRKKRLP